MTFADLQRVEAIFIDANTFTTLASEDADFDRAPWLTRYEPI